MLGSAALEGAWAEPRDDDEDGSDVAALRKNGGVVAERRWSICFAAGCVTEEGVKALKRDRNFSRSEDSLGAGSLDGTRLVGGEGEMWGLRTMRYPRLGPLSSAEDETASDL